MVVTSRVCNMIVPLDADWITIGIYHDYDARHKPLMRAGGPVVSLQTGNWVGVMSSGKKCKMVTQRLAL
ncbi:hypothetical protein PPTG_21783 [Phytophthora nicotianae INRA-310]|uniref:Uncharacterized protein n=1 Tax=Phytophthora nicotianae (strain INRA-310) TaxID=761204 RepID=W2QUE5_PHYN3|nr:hypothetical protein PPTG_21783 [Phytophthora nicotianae INRA-310]ETN16787.1 hypothetical protein PPTG_21783 [Phytophthora nicotianae INRA-310]